MPYEERQLDVDEVAIEKDGVKSIILRESIPVWVDVMGWSVVSETPSSAPTPAPTPASEPSA